MALGSQEVEDSGMGGAEFLSTPKGKRTPPWKLLLPRRALSTGSSQGDLGAVCCLPFFRLPRLCSR